MLSVRGLRWTYPGRDTPALDGVDLEISDEVTGLTGPSGCGKSTLAKWAAGWLGDVPGPPAPAAIPVQYVCQEPGASLNPRFTALEAVAEPLAIRREVGAQTRAIELMEMVGIDRGQAGKLTSEFSGGERARLAIARAIAAIGERPGVLILDESLSSLDAVTQERMVELLRSLRVRLRLSYLIVSHDLALLAEFADHLVVMDEGRVVESGATREVLSAPRHPLTVRLAACFEEGGSR